MYIDGYYFFGGGGGGILQTHFYEVWLANGPSNPRPLETDSSS